MPEFLRLSLPDEAIKTLLQSLPPPSLPKERIDTKHSLGRILAEDLVSTQALPAFPRSTVDGYAVRSHDTHGASDNQPNYLFLQGEIKMGIGADREIQPDTCILIHTGGMLPRGSDAVVMLEYTQLVDTMERVTKPGASQRTIVEIMKPVSVGENIIQVGEDVTEAQVVIRTGTKMRPAEIGGCLALGITKVNVVKPPRVAIISSGDELVDPNHEPQLGQIRDINSYTLSAMVEQAGGEPVYFGIVPDDLAVLIKAASEAITSCDLLIITAGSSAGARDNTAQAINAIGDPGVLLHGLNLRPGKPTILAVCNQKPVIGLPGNPVSALVVSRLILRPLVHHLLGYSPHQIEAMVLARLSINIPSQAGREDWIPVRLSESFQAQSQGFDHPRYIAEPIFGKSNLIFTLVYAQGFVCIPPQVTGVSAGEVVEVRLLE